MVQSLHSTLARMCHAIAVVSVSLMIPLPFHSLISITECLVHFGLQPGAKPLGGEREEQPPMLPHCQDASGHRQRTTLRGSCILCTPPTHSLPSLYPVPIFIPTISERSWNESRDWIQGYVRRRLQAESTWPHASAQLCDVLNGGATQCVEI